MADSPQRLSGPFAFVAGTFMLFSTAAATRYLWKTGGFSPPHLAVVFEVLLVWAALASAAMIFWGVQACRKYLLAKSAALTSGTPSPAPGIGHPTLEMIGGLSAAVIAAVTLALILADSANNADHSTEEANHTIYIARQQVEAIRSQSDLIREQTKELRLLRDEVPKDNKQRASSRHQPIGRVQHHSRVKGAECPSN